MELTKNKYVIGVICCFLQMSCTDTKQKNQDDSSQKNNTEINIDSNQAKVKLPDTSKIDSTFDSNKKDIETPKDLDYESVYEFQYESYINKAYDKKTYEEYYQSNSYQSKHLDSLINIYENNIDTADKNKSNSHPEYYDEYSETIRYYKSYINKAYDNETHSQYFGTSKQKVLDSLITKYEENKN